jgi:group II intron reverse transcriptase/maturase
MQRVDGVKVTRLTLGDLLVWHALATPRGVTRDRQKSAEVIVAAAHGGKGPNTREWTGTERSMTERVAGEQAEMLKRPRRAGGGAAEGKGFARQAGTARNGNAGDKRTMIMEEVCARENLMNAYRRVMRNAGAPGTDGMTVEELMPYCRKHWARIREELLNGKYDPKPVRRVEIPKPDGRGTRMLGIPAVVDRLIQQALLQVLTPIYDPTFSEDSYGFRPGRSALDAVLRAQEHMMAGNRWVVDLDLEKFFDRVNHDILMSRVARRIKDKGVLRLIRRYLQAGVMEGGLMSPRTEGTPQGGPLSPLLSNILLDELDKELEQRGHRFVRYADDCNVYVKSRRAGERVMTSLEKFLLKRLRLPINRDKSAVDRPWKRNFLGYSVTANRRPKLKVAPESVKRLKTKLRGTFRCGRGRNLDRVCQELTVILRGWVAYYRLSEVKASFELLDMWTRRKLRGLLWRQWKRPRTRRRELVRRGLSPERAATSAYNGHGSWWNAGASHMNQAVPTSDLRKLGLISLIDEHRRLSCIS